MPAREPGVLLSYRPLREKGDRIAVTRTNRDYLGVITAIGPDAAAVDLVRRGLRANGNWEITEPPVSDRCRRATTTERELAARVIDTLLREDYGGLSQPDAAGRRRPGA